MKTEKDLPYVLEDEFRQPNDHLDWCLEFGEEYNPSDLYEWILFLNKINKTFEKAYYHKNKPLLF